jgi:ribose transport system ATP-binding protein
MSVRSRDPAPRTRGDRDRADDPATDVDDVLVALRGATKTFAGVHALSGVDLEVRRSECHAVVGENGAGKSTLMKLLAGAHAPDAGFVELEGRPVTFAHPRDAREHGISTIFQEFTLLPDRTVADNVFLGRELRRGPFLRRGAMATRTGEILELLGLGGTIRADQPVRTLPVAGQQLVEVAKALAFDARLVIMDEPTAPLSTAEVQLLHERVRLLQQRGIAVLYVTHRLEEVFAVADRVTVLKDGEHVTTRPTAELDEHRLVELMVGRELGDYYPPRASEADVGEVVLSVRGGGVGSLQGIDVEVRAGEIVGLAGLQGAGRTELLRAVFGAAPFTEGTIRVLGNDRPFRSPRGAVAAGVGLVPEDRKTDGLVLEHSVADNLLLPLRSTRRGRAAARSDRGDVVDRVSGEVELRGVTARSEVQFASGGNQQKVVLGKWLTLGVGLLLLDEPTRGVDVGAKAAVHDLIRALARDGMAILMASSELPEIIGMSDRIVVVREGSTVGELPSGSSEAEILRLATGGR